jgi:hypothetical protein
LFFALLRSLRSVCGGAPPVNGVSLPAGGSSPAAAAPPDAQEEAVTEELFAKVRVLVSLCATRARTPPVGWRCGACCLCPAVVAAAAAYL